MTWQAWMFAVLPGIAALALGWTIRRWWTAGLAALVSLGLFHLIPTLGLLHVRPFAPLLTGAALAGVVLTILLAIRPGLTIWQRIVPALTVVLAAHLTYLYLAMAGR